jgi:hypothetical protein
MKKMTFLSWMACLFFVASFTSLYAQEKSETQAPAPTAVEPSPAPIPEIPPLSTRVSEVTSVVETAPVAPAVVEQPAVQPVTVTEPSAPKFVVFLPEKVDLMWCWYYYTDVQQHFVQSAVEKALVNAGKDIVDLSISDAFPSGGSIAEITNPAEAVKKAKALGATFAIIGQAQAIKSGENEAYGVHVARASAEASARIIRVKDGKLIAIEEATAQGSGQSAQAASQAALKDVAKKIASKIATAVPQVESAK